MFYQTDDVRISKIKELLPPIALIERFPASQEASKSVFAARTAISNIFNHQDVRKKFGKMNSLEEEKEDNIFNPQDVRKKIKDLQVQGIIRFYKKRIP